MTQGLAQNSGVGFAVPINVAKSVLPQLREKGHVTRGWLGLQIQSLNEDLAASMNLKGTEGALVSDVKRGGPAEAAGVKAGDVIRTIDGSTVHDSADLTQMVATLAPGSKVKLGIVRDGSEKTLTATLGTFPEGKGGEASGGASEKGKLGLSLSPLDEQTAGQLDMPRGSTGLVVQGVEPGSPAELAGLRRGDVIVSVNGHDATSADQLTKATEGNHPARLRIYRDDGYFFLVLKPAESDSSR